MKAATTAEAASAGSRFPVERVILTQTDTTVGFLSRDAAALERIKARPGGKPFLKVFPGLAGYREAGGRIPPAFRRMLRYARKTTFVVKGQAFRIVRDPRHLALLQRCGWMYSTSANRSGEAFERAFCESHADIVVEEHQGLHEAPASSIVRLGRTKQRSLR